MLIFFKNSPIHVNLTENFSICWNKLNFVDFLLKFGFTKKNFNGNKKNTPAAPVLYFKGAPKNWLNLTPSIELQFLKYQIQQKTYRCLRNNQIFRHICTNNIFWQFKTHVITQAWVNGTIARGIGRNLRIRRCTGRNWRIRKGSSRRLANGLRNPLKDLILFLKSRKKIVIKTFIIISKLRFRVKRNITITTTYVRFSRFYWHFEILDRKTGY